MPHCHRIHLREQIFYYDAHPSYIRHVVNLIPFRCNVNHTPQGGS